MTYQAKRTHGYIQELELVEADGTVVHCLKVALDPGTMAERLSRQHMEIVKVQKEVQAIDASIKNQKILLDAYQKLGNAVMTEIRSVFGDEQSDIIFDFYNGDYNSIVKEVYPFISEVVIPDVRRIAQQNKREILQKYNRKTRRALKGERWGI